MGLVLRGRGRSFLLALGRLSADLLPKSGARRSSWAVGRWCGAHRRDDSRTLEKLGDVEPSPQMEPEQARFRLFDAITGFLKKASEDSPLLLVLDDLH